MRAKITTSIAVFVVAISAFALARHFGKDVMNIETDVSSVELPQAVSDEPGRNPAVKSSATSSGHLSAEREYHGNAKSQRAKWGATYPAPSPAVADFRQQADRVAVSKDVAAVVGAGMIDSVSPPLDANRSGLALLAPEASDPGITYPPPNGNIQNLAGHAADGNDSSLANAAPEANDPGIAYPAPEAGDQGIAYPAPEDGGW